MDNSSGIYNLINNKQISKSIINVLANNIDFNTYSSPKGLKELRQQICIFLKNIWNYNINYHDMLITTGSQQSINIIANTILSAGDTILIEQPTYFGAIKVFKYKYNWNKNKFPWNKYKTIRKSNNKTQSKINLCNPYF